MIIPADMPDLTREDIELLVAAHQKNPEVIAQAISTNGRLGHPVVFPNRCFKSLTTLKGDQGARALIAQDRKAIKHIALPGSHATNDLDTPEDWMAWRRGSELRKN
jgi:CTP:molybdopterin cytidylyltransferase MocA